MTIEDSHCHTTKRWSRPQANEGYSFQARFRVLGDREPVGGGDLAVRRGPLRPKLDPSVLINLLRQSAGSD